ncbi:MULTISPECIES: hypothetical protein [Clostridium]|uniref:Uncharacterized protein n=2 Tax=Clostridium TaxID=1485 RepID=A0A151ASD3_9CLOT|nr:MULTISPECIES: hypothetical protein [Clostridium]KYH30287.1 hypothetical protein CLCOL_02330 [Clostridium colicanis DSM 13634]PRR69401.1 hypothetical protein CPAL_24870 [Clostridium thermopalmarium DSM 5974]PVZ26333.1 hypothetical protein LX19_00829 [Clostridium thermopalmarium DSM 5974]
MGNKNSSKTDMISEKRSREFSKVNMKAFEDMGMPNTDKKRKSGKGFPINQFK